MYHPVAEGETFEEGFDKFIFDVKEIKEKYYLSEKVAKYVLAGGTKNLELPQKLILMLQDRCYKQCTRCIELV